MSGTARCGTPPALLLGVAVRRKGAGVSAGRRVTSARSNRGSGRGHAMNPDWDTLYRLRECGEEANAWRQDGKI